MATDYSILIVPGLVILVFFIKYLVQRLYGLHSAKLEAERIENLNRLMRHNPLLLSNEEMHTQRIAERLRRNPPPDYDRVQQCSIPIFYIQMDDAPPPTYDEYMRMTGDNAQSSLSPPPYQPL